MTVTAEPGLLDPAPSASSGDQSPQGSPVVFTGEPHSPVASDAFAELSSSDVLSVVEQMEALKTWADYVGLAATSELSRREERTALEEAGPDVSATVRTGARVAAHSATADELVLATGIGYRDALARVLFSLADPARVDRLRTRLRDGQLPWHRARILHEDCADLPPALAADIADAVLAPTPGGAALSGSLFRQRLTRHLARHQPATTQRAHALAARALSVSLNPDGTGTLTLTGAAARLRGAHQRIDTIARRIRAAGSARTLAQLRSDIALDLILFGNLPGKGAQAEAQAPTSEPASTAGNHATATDSEPPAPTPRAGNATRPDPVKPFRATAARTAADADADADDVSPAAKARSPFDPATAPESHAGATAPTCRPETATGSERPNGTPAAAPTGASEPTWPSGSAATTRDANRASAPNGDVREGAATEAAETIDTPWAQDRADPLATAPPPGGPPGTVPDEAHPPSEVPPPQVDVPGWDPESTDCSIDPALFGQHLPAAHVTVTVALSTLLGLDHEPGLLGGADGHDYLDADTIRATAMTAGSTWRRLVTDPLTGHAHELSTTSYRPGPPLTRAIWARDQHCRVPGCTTPATRSDLDHDIDYHQGGTTSLDNLSAKHRRHHNHKTTRRWHTHRHGDTITWTTGTGRTYTSHPADHRPPPREPSHSLLEAEFTHLLAHAMLDPTDLHPPTNGPDHSLDENPPPPEPPEPHDPGPPPF